MHRRSFLRNTSCLAGTLLTRLALASPAPPIPSPIIDTHIHLFDPTRPGGVAWPLPDDPVLYRPALPDRYQQVTRGLGIVGAIAIEASPLQSDNDWLLVIARRHPIIIGIIGDLIPGSPDFAKDLDRLHADPLLLGIRYGNLWDRDLSRDIHTAGFLEGLRQLSHAGLVFESANPDPTLVHTLVDLAQQLPELTIVVDHLPHTVPPTEPAANLAYRHSLATLAAAPRVFIKLSEIPAQQDGQTISDPHAYRDHIQELWQLFGDNKVMFGSDWPNSDHLLPYPQTFNILSSYVSTQSTAARNKLYWKNSIAAYRWRPRLKTQPVL